MYELPSDFQKLGGIEPVTGNSFFPLNNDEILALQARLDCQLPSDYKSFLQQYAGSRFGLMTRFAPSIPLPQYISSSGKGLVDYFFGNAKCAYSLPWAIDCYTQRIPETLLPIAANLAGGLVCLGILCHRQNHIYYWDNQHEVDWDDFETEEELETAKYQNVFYIAESFSDFLEQLETYS